MTTRFCHRVAAGVGSTKFFQVIAQDNAGGGRACDYADLGCRSRIVGQVGVIRARTIDGDVQLAAACHSLAVTHGVIEHLDRRLPPGKVSVVCGRGVGVVSGRTQFQSAVRSRQCLTNGNTGSKGEGTACRTGKFLVQNYAGRHPCGVGDAADGRVVRHARSADRHAHGECSVKTAQVRDGCVTGGLRDGHGGRLHATGVFRRTCRVLEADCRVGCEK